jgi:amino acid permease
MAKRAAADDISDVRFAALTSAIIIASYIVAMTVSSLEAVLAYVGSTGSTSISFILPGLFYYKISDPNSPHHQRLMKDDDYDSLDSNSDDDDDVDSEERAPLTASLASLRGSVRRGARRARRGVSVPKGLLRKLSLVLTGYGIVVMVVCLGTNAFFSPKRQ